MAETNESKINDMREQGDLSKLISFRLRKLTTMYTKASASVYRREFELTLNEWRVMSLLYAAGTLSLSRLAHQALFDRGLTTRVVGELIERGLVSRSADPNDGRGVVLGLSKTGKSMVAKVAPRAYERNRQLMSCLTNKETEQLDVILDKLTHQAQIMLDIEHEAAATQREAAE